MAELGDDSQSMTLVLLSYNRGAEAVRDALRQLRESDQNYERNFWTLFANRDKLGETFQKESANYVPGFFAVAIIGENPEVFELGTPPLSSLAKWGSSPERSATGYSFRISSRLANRDRSLPLPVLTSRRHCSRYSIFTSDP